MKKVISFFLILGHLVQVSVYAQEMQVSDKDTTINNGIIQEVSDIQDEITAFPSDESTANYDFVAAEIEAANQAELERANAEATALEQRQATKRSVQLNLSEGNIAQALPFIQQLVIQDPTNIDNYNLLAESYLLTGDYDAAAMTYHHLVELLYLTDDGSMNGSPYFSILKRFHEFELPLEVQLTVFKELAALEDYDVFPLVLLAGFSIDNSRYSEAESYLERALQINPENAKIYTLYTFIYWNQGEPEKAIALLEDAYNTFQDPEMGLEYANALISNFDYEKAYQQLIPLMITTNEAPPVFEKFIGMAYVMGNYDNIRDMLTLRLNQPEVLTRAVLNLFYFSEILGNSENLLKVLPEIPNPTPEYAEALYTIKAKVALLAGDIKQFNQYFDAISALAILEPATVAMKKMMMLEKEQQYALLDNELIENSELFDSNNQSNLTFLRAMSAFGKKDYDTMIHLFEEEMKANPQDAIAYNALGFSLVEIDPANAEKALPLITKANLMLPNQDFIEDSLAWTYFQLGELELADKYISKAYHKNKDPEIIAHYIVILDALGETEEAKALYHKFNLFFGNSKSQKIITDNVDWAAN